LAKVRERFIFPLLQILGKTIYLQADSQGRLCLPIEQPTVNIAEIVEEDEIPLKNAIEAPPLAQPGELKAEPIEPYIEELVYKPLQQEKDESKSASTTKTPLPAKRKRGRRAGSGVTPRRRKQPGIDASQEANGDPKILTVVDVVDGRPLRPRRAKAARNKLVIVGADDSVSDA
ncbi:hypothetical protein TELCIR_00788, partial [Teladorsagia circumcincta]